MKLNKKLLLGLGSVAVGIIPVATVVSCASTGDSSPQLSNPSFSGDVSLDSLKSENFENINKIYDACEKDEARYVLDQMVEGHVGKMFVAWEHTLYSKKLFYDLSTTVSPQEAEIVPVQSKFEPSSGSSSVYKFKLVDDCKYCTKNSGDHTVHLGWEYPISDPTYAFKKSNLMKCFTEMTNKYPGYVAIEPSELKDSISWLGEDGWFRIPSAVINDWAAFVVNDKYFSSPLSNHYRAWSNLIDYDVEKPLFIKK